MKSGLCGVLLLLLVTSLSFAAPAKKTLTPKDVLSIRAAGDIDVCPAEGRAAFIVTEPDFSTGEVRSSLWVASFGEKASRQWTKGDRKERMPLWSPAGRHLAFLARAGDEKEPQVWVIPAAGGESEALTDAPGGVLDYCWLDDDTVVYLAGEPIAEGAKMRRTRDDVMKNDGAVVDAPSPRKDIWRVSLSTRESLRLFRGDPGILEVRASPGKREILFTTNYTGRPDDAKKVDMWILDLQGKNARRLAGLPGEEYSPRWSPRGDRVAYLAHLDPERPQSRGDLYVMPSGGGEPVNLTASLDRNVFQFAWDEGGEALYAAVEEGVYHSVYRVEAKGGGLEPVLKDTQYLYSFDVAPGGRLVLAREEPSRPPDICLYDIAAASLTRLSDLTPWLAEYAIAPSEVVTWKNPSDGLELQGVLVKPLDYEPGKRYPLIVRIHGGPYGTAAHSLLYYPEYQALPPLGYMVFAPNYRGSSGWGNAFGLSNYRDLGGLDHLDIVSGVDALVEKGLADPERLAVMGLSYGGYMTNWIVGHTDRFKAAVSIAGIFSLYSDFSNSSFPAWEREYLGAYYWDDLAPYLARSPSSFGQKITTPVLIMHGDEDDNTFITNSKEMYQMLFHLGRTVQFVRYPREGHGFEEPNHVLDSVLREVRWFDRYVLGKSWRVPVGQWADSGELRAKALAWEKWDGELRDAPGDDGYVLTLCLKAPEGTALCPAKEVVLLDGKEGTHSPEGLVAGEGASRYLVTGEPSIFFDGEREITVRLLFRVPRGAGRVTLQVGSAPAMQLERE